MKISDLVQMLKYLNESKDHWYGNLVIYDDGTMVYKTGGEENKSIKFFADEGEFLDYSVINLAGIYDNVQ